MIKTSDNCPIYLDFLDFKWSQHNNRLGITLAPGKFQPNGYTGRWERDLMKDLNRLKNQYHIQVLVSLLEKDEAERLKIPHQLEECEKMGIKAYNFPVRDTTIPEDKEAYKKLAKEIVDEHLRKGKNLVVHCMGGLGRAPTFVATCLIYAGLTAEEAIKLVQKARKDSLTLQCQKAFLRQLKFN